MNKQQRHDELVELLKDIKERLARLEDRLHGPASLDSSEVTFTPPEVNRGTCSCMEGPWQVLGSSACQRCHKRIEGMPNPAEPYFNPKIGCDADDLKPTIRYTETIDARQWRPFGEKTAAEILGKKSGFDVT